MKEKLSQRLLQFRKRFNYSQEELANILQVSRQSIIKWENGETLPSIEFITMLSKLYKVSIDDLLNIEKPIEDCFKEQEEVIDNNEQPEVIQINKDGIYVKDGNDEVSIDTNGINIVDSNEKINIKVNNKDKRKIISDIILNSSIILITIIYLLCGFLIKSFQAFTLLWPLYFIPFIITSIYEAIAYKKLSKFNISFVCVFIYTMVGMYGSVIGNFQGWHPYWVIFLIVPIYYSIIKFFTKTIKKLKE